MAYLRYYCKCMRLHSHVSALTMTTPYKPNCHFTADCTRKSDQTVRQIKQCLSRRLVGGPVLVGGPGPTPPPPPLDPALTATYIAELMGDSFSLCFLKMTEASHVSILMCWQARATSITQTSIAYMAFFG